jgi:hypothetical protein
MNPVACKGRRAYTCFVSFEEEPVKMPVGITFELAGFSLEVLGRQFPDAQDYWDGNWLEVKCTCAAPGSFVEAEGPFVHLSEIERLETLLSGTERERKMNLIEPDLALSFEAGNLGDLSLNPIIPVCCHFSVP